MTPQPINMSAPWSVASGAVRTSPRGVKWGLAGPPTRPVAVLPPHCRRPFSMAQRHLAKATPAAHSKGTAKAGPRDNRQPVAELLSQRKTPLVAAGLAAMVIGGYLSMLVMSAATDPRHDDAQDYECCTPTGRPLDVRQGRITALVFDQELNASEGRMGIKKLRKLMGGLARGHVLEVAVGTGRNVDYVDWDEIRAAAPPVVAAAAAGEGEERRGVKSEKELERERVMRRMNKGERGMVLPGDEAPEVVSYTGVDVSTDVLEVAWGKLRKAVPELVPRRRRTSQEEQQQQQRQNETQGQQHTKPSAPQTTTAVLDPQPSRPDALLAANIGAGRIRLYKSDAQESLPAPPALTSHDSTRVHPAPRFYDTVMQNFGLCSVADPQRLLTNMAAVLRPGSGRIYLLEHGRGSYGWLNSLLDKFAPNHFRKYGCWWNRDIEEIVRRAEREVPGLEVVRVDRPLWMQGGTMLWIELKVNPEKVGAEAASMGTGSNKRG